MQKNMQLLPKQELKKKKQGENSDKTKQVRANTAISE